MRCKLVLACAGLNASTTVPFYKLLSNGEVFPVNPGVLIRGQFNIAEPATETALRSGERIEDFFVGQTLLTQKDGLLFL